MKKTQLTQRVRPDRRRSWIKRATVAGVVVATAGLVARSGSAAPPTRSAAPTAAELEVTDYGASGKQRTARFVVALGEEGAPSRIEVRVEGATYEVGVRHRATRDKVAQVELDLRRSLSQHVGGKHHSSSARMVASQKMRVGQRAIFGELALAGGRRTEVALTLR